MHLADITPLVLTFNEAPNIRDTLSRLQWATRIVVVDSYSTDETLQVVSEFTNVEVFQRTFDNHTTQWNFGLSMIKSDWTLSLDADYKCPAGIASEIEKLDGCLPGYQANFSYCILGRPLRASLYPPRVVLFRNDQSIYERDGHTQRIKVDGEIGQLETVLLHDDCKSLSTWFAAQVRYAGQEANKLCAASTKQLGWKDRIRKSSLLAPVLTLFYCLFWKGLILDGWRGVFYTLQRVYAELLLSLVLLDGRLRAASGEEQSASEQENAKT